MKRFFQIIPVLFLAACLTACVVDQSELGPKKPHPEAVRIRFSVSTAQAPKSRAVEAGSTYENLLKEVTILIFGYSTDGTGTLEAAEHFSLASLPVEQTQWATDSILLVEHVDQLTSPKNVYVIGNWTGFQASRYTVTTTPESVLLAEMTRITGPIAVPTATGPVLMSGKALNYVFSANNNQATVKMARQYAKIRLNITLDSGFTGTYGSRLAWGGAAGSFRSRTVNVPNYSFVAARTPAASPTTGDAADYKLIHYGYRTLSEISVPSPHWVDSCYVYENPVRGNTAAVKGKATYVILHLPYTLDGVPRTDNYYKVYLDNSAQNATDPYMSERNNIYQLNVTIKGFGLPEELAIPDALAGELTVLPWDDDIQFTTILETDDKNGQGNGEIDPWDKQPGQNGDLEEGKDPSDEDDEQGGKGGGNVNPWNPNGSQTEF